MSFRKNEYPCWVLFELVKIFPLQVKPNCHSNLSRTIHKPIMSCTVDACDRSALSNQEKCVLHSASTEKDSTAFEEVLREHQAEQSGNYQQIVFPSDVEFREAEFEDVDFTDALFRGQADFTGATFEGRTDFTGAEFSGPATFTGTSFDQSPTFHEVTFGGETHFDRSQFLRTWGTDPRRVGFIDCVFEGRANFSESRNRNALFHECTFEQQADFPRAQFDLDVSGAVFESCEFQGSANFTNATHEGTPLFGRSCHFKNLATFKGARFEGGKVVRGSVYFEGSISFERADFVGGLMLRAATFEEQSPSFKGATLSLGSIDYALQKKA